MKTFLAIVAFVALVFASVISAEEYVWSATLNSNQVVPEGGNVLDRILGAWGDAAINWNDGSRKLWVSWLHTLDNQGTFTGAALYNGEAGDRGSLIYTIDATGASPGAIEDQFTFDDGDVDSEGVCAVCDQITEAGKAGNLYIEITTSLYSDGALRGQFAPAGRKDSFSKEANANGDDVLPEGVDTESSGSCSFNYDGETALGSFSCGVGLANREEGVENQLSAVKVYFGPADRQHNEDLTGLLHEFEDVEDLFHEQVISPNFARIMSTDNAAYAFVETTDVPSGELRGNFRTGGAGTLLFSVAVLAAGLFVNMLF